MQVKLAYGKKIIDFDIPVKDVTVCAASDIEPSKEGRLIVKEAIENPIESKSLVELAKNRKNVCIVINDVTRPTPSKIIVSAILEKLYEAGIHDDQITILVANGNHRATTTDELRMMLGDEIVDKIKIVNHVAASEEDMVYLGDTSMGVPIHVNKVLAESDMRILTGTIRPHQSAGFSGGRKSILPGCASVKSIMKHHSFPIFPLTPQLGKYFGNPFHEQALEGARLVGVDFIVNVIENAHAKIIDAVAGDLNAAHVLGTQKCSSIWMYELDAAADIIITSPGGHPKDINLHQSQKAIAPCELSLKKGGVMILLASCPDGAGHIPDWFQEADNPEDVIEHFKKVGWTPLANAKPFMLARPLSNYHMIVVSDGIQDEILKSMFMIPAHSLDEAWTMALEICKVQDPKVLVLPTAGDVIPFVKDTTGLA